MSAKRIITDIFLIIIVFLMPWWLTLLFLLAALFYFSEPPFWEALIIGFILDMFYSGAIQSLPFSIIFTLTSYALFIVTLLLKKRLKFY